MPQRPAHAGRTFSENAMNLTDTQHAVLHAAATQTGGRLEHFPRNVQGGARFKVVRALLAADVIIADGTDHWLTDAGYAAIGLEPPAPVAATPASERSEAATPLREEPATTPHTSGERRTRANSKQAQIIAMLQRPEGATIAQLAGATGWLAHTIRGTLSGVLKNRLGLSIGSEKLAGAARVYRIVP